MPDRLLHLIGSMVPFRRLQVQPPEQLRILGIQRSLQKGTEQVMVHHTALRPRGEQALFQQLCEMFLRIGELQGFAQAPWRHGLKGR
ncbi:MAG: hypothetical protein GYB64_06645 [Chloroflexi bacterium]|nr:hypothetical protein [Chloroflexota bacterium]